MGARFRFIGLVTLGVAALCCASCADPGQPGGEGFSRDQLLALWSRVSGRLPSEAGRPGFWLALPGRAGALISSALPAAVPRSVRGGASAPAAARPAAPPAGATSVALSRYYTGLSSWDEASMAELLLALREIEAPGKVAVGELYDATKDMERDPFAN